MSEKDIAISEIKLAKEGIFDLKEVNNIINEFFLQKDYDLTEKEHSFNESGNLKIKWEAVKKVDDYSRFEIDVTISGSGIKDIELKKKKAMSGKFSVKFEAWIEKDYEEKWEEPLMKFLRGVYDKFIIGSKFEMYNKRITDETYALYNEIKAYIGLKG